MNIVNDKNRVKLIVSENPNDIKLLDFADLLEQKIGVCFTEKVNDFDTLFWDFIYEENKFTLNYNNFFGISIYPDINNSSTQDKLLELANKIKQF